MSKVLGILFMLIAAVLVLQVVKAVWALMIISGLILGLLAAMRLIGRWGYAAAAVALLMALPGLLFRTAAAATLLGFRLLPLVLAGYGLYAIIKALRR